MQLLLLFMTYGLLYGANNAAAAHSADPQADIASEVANPVPDDAEMDALFSIPEIARTIVAARADAEPAEDATPLLGPIEIWARGRRWRKFDSKQTAAVLEHLTADEVSALRALCGRCLYHTLNHDLAAHGNAYEHVFVATGDIDAQWLRDSAVQLAIYLPRIAAHPIIRPIIEGAIRSQAYWILYDPHANAFNRQWRPTSTFDPADRRVAKGGWIWEHKFEVDSGAYYFNLLWNYYNTPGLFKPEKLLDTDTTIHDAVVLLLHTWQLEQHHEEKSTYLFAAELPRSGKGTPTNYTGLIWGGFRPSDDGQKYGYNIPANMYAAGALRRLLALNEALWGSAEVQRRAGQLLADISAGLQKWATTKAPDGSTVYAYEVDGLGNALVDFDDPNLPSLLAMPLLGYEYDAKVYAATRRRILSTNNPFYFKGAAFTGLGSPHTPHRYIWPLAHMVDALTTEPTPEGAVHQAGLVRDLLKMQCGNGLMHESVDVDDPMACTRPIFEWSNAMLVVMAEQLLDIDCATAAEEAQLRVTVRREWDGSTGRGGGIADSLLQYYRLPEADVPHQP